MGSTLLTGCGTILSGDLAQPVLDGNSVRIEGERIVDIGEDLDPGDAEIVVDLDGGTVIPGLVDSHSHPVVGDFTPRQNTLGWTSRALHGGVTSLVSAGETHWPGRQKDGAEAVAICRAALLTSRERIPGCARVFGGALLLDVGVDERAIVELHESGVRMLGEIGLGSEKDVERIAQLVGFARELGWVAPLHFGGASVPGSSVVDLDFAMSVRPSVISHANGGPTARPVREVMSLIDHTDATIELVFAGNTRAAIEIARYLDDRGETDRLQIGTDTPSGTGVVPLGMLRLITELVSLAGLEPAQAICAASGSTAARYGLAAHPSTISATEIGRVAKGCVADLVVLDNPLGSMAADACESMQNGNVPAVAAVLVEGEVVLTRSVATPPPTRAVQ